MVFPRSIPAIPAIRATKALRALASVLFTVALLAPTGRAQVLDGPQLPEIDWTQRQGAQVPMETRFLDETGRETSLAELVGDRPVILALVYYECPMLCNLVLDGLVRSLRALKFDAGNEFEVIALSIDPQEPYALGRDRKAGCLEQYGRPQTTDGWHFLTGSESAIAAVADSVGFGFVYVPETDEYAHAAGITLLSSGGRVTHYFYGHEYAARDLRFGLVEAADGKVGSPIDKVLLRCFHYDPTKGRYGLAIMTVIRVLGAVTLALMGTFIVRMMMRERRAQDRSPAATGESL